jgi:probable rRNA maturation factor
VNISTIELHLDIAADLSASLQASVPAREQILQWLTAALQQVKYTKPIELTLRVVTIEESNQLNLTYRNKNNPTNVLSFESDIPEYVDSAYIGDMVICAEVLASEAKNQNKINAAHWAHLCVHGLLHLLGYDHLDEIDAAEMEAIEIATLAAMCIDDPYDDR